VWVVVEVAPLIAPLAVVLMVLRGMQLFQAVSR